MAMRLVADGDSVCSIAAESGHLPQTLWNDPANAALKNLRKDQELLVPGDQIEVMDLRPKSVSCATGQRHVFRAGGRLVEFTLVVEDEEGEPFAGKRYELAVEDQTLAGNTDDAGKIECSIPASSRSGTLQLWLDEPGVPNPWVRELRLGTLHPPDHLVGVQRRLSNLGLWFGPVAELPAASLSALQTAQGLTATGEMDDATVQKIAAIHRV